MTVVPFMILLFGVVDGIGEDLENRSEEEIYGRLDKMSSELSTLLQSQKSLAKGLARVPAVKTFAEVSSENRSATYQDKAGELVFRGGTSKSPSQHGMVSIVFDNHNKTFPLDAKEVHIIDQLQRWTGVPS